MPTHLAPEPVPMVCICGKTLQWRMGATRGGPPEPRWACPAFDFADGLRSPHIDLTVGMLMMRPGGQALIARNPFRR